jgi:hypothetical protein
VSTAETTIAVWKEFVLTLRGKYDILFGSSDSMVMKRLLFHENWKFYSHNNKNVTWRC